MGITETVLQYYKWFHVDVCLFYLFNIFVGLRLSQLEQRSHLINYLQVDHLVDDI